jgi:hypothetical protein
MATVSCAPSHESDPMADNAPRRFTQFSLRSLLVLTLFVAAFFAGMATERRRAERAIEVARKEAEAAREAERLARMNESLTRQRDLARILYESAFKTVVVEPSGKQ